MSTEPVEVDVTEPEDDEADEATAAAPAPAPEGEPRPPRRERRQNRYREVQERLAAAERRAEAAEQRAHEAAMYAQQAATRQPEQDPERSELDRIYGEQQSLGRDWQALVSEARAAGREVSEADRERLFARGRKIEEEKANALYRQAAARNAPSQADMHRAQNYQQLQARYPDIMADQQRVAWAVARYNMLVSEGRPHGWETTDVAMKDAAARFATARPDPGMRDRLAGVPRSAVGGPEPGRVVLDETAQRMADAAFSHIKDQGERYKHYAKVLQQKRSARGG